VKGLAVFESATTAALGRAGDRVVVTPRGLLDIRTG
jgi:hypothetical protein